MVSAKITSVNALIRELHIGTVQQAYLSTMHNLAINPEELFEYCTWNEKNYTRNLLEKNNEFELILMCWETKQASPIHSYNHEEGWIYVVQGQLSINHYFESFGESKMQFYKEVKLDTGNSLYLNDYLGFHSVENSCQKRTISLHLHAGPVEKWKVYDPENDAYFLIDTRFDSKLEP